MRYALVVMIATLSLGGCKGDRAKCEKAARNFFELRFWARTNAELAQLPESQRDLYRSKKVSEFTNRLEEQIDFRVEQCVSANNEEQIDCMIAAKNEAQVLKCADPAEDAK
jgi:hypothetical protein